MYTSNYKSNNMSNSSSKNVELTNVRIIPDEYLGQHNLAFQSNELSDSEEPTGVVITENNSATNFRRSNWTYPNISIDRDHPPGSPVPNGIDHQGQDNDQNPPQPRRKMTAAQLMKITYSWKDVSISATSENDILTYLKQCTKTNKIKQPPKQLLKKASGAISSGELTCILGASGAGKTTLLNALTFRTGSNLKLSGERYINGEPVNANLLSTISAYIQQEDLFVGTLTVREHLKFHAMLRMHKNIPSSERMQRVEEVIDEFGLRKCANTIIGIPGRIKGLSGGEKKRLAFASEILTDPVILFCDEPTSGLDSYMAQTIVQVMKAQAEKGKGIICTIHQPSSALYQLFDRVLVMAEGRVAYFGPTPDVLPFLAGEGYPCPANYNPAEFLTETLAIQPENEVKSRAIVNAICDGFEKTSTCADLKKIIADNSSLSTVPTQEGVPPVRLGGYNQRASSHYKASWLSQFTTVLWRSWISYVKDPFVLNLRILQNIALALIIGCVYWGQEMNQDGVQNINGAVFLFISAVTYQNVFGVADVFCSELPVFLREHYNGMYRTDVYYLSKVGAELPFYFLFPAMMVSIAYYMIGFHDTVESFLYTIAILILITNVTTALGYFLSCLANTVTMALIIAPALIFPFFLFGGFFMNAGTGPVVLRWVKDLSWFYYGFEALAIAQWKDVENITCNHSNGTCIGGVLTGKMVLQSMGFDEKNMRYDLIALGSLVAGFQAIAFLSLLAKTLRRK